MEMQADRLAADFRLLILSLGLIHFGSLAHYGASLGPRLWCVTMHTVMVRPVLFCSCFMLIGIIHLSLCVRVFTGRPGISLTCVLTPCRLVGVCVTVVLLGMIGVAVWAVGETHSLLLILYNTLSLLFLPLFGWTL